ncbi:MAG: amidohydrolase [Candidatus Bathyarchaeia archaeon]
MVTLIMNGFLITMDEKNPVIKDGAIYFEDERILEVGISDELKRKYPSAETINAKNKIIMPGLISSHSHLYGILAHGIPFKGEVESFIEILEKLWWPYVEDKMNKGLIYKAALASSLEMIRSGTTCTVDILEAPYAIPGALEVEAKALKETGMRAILSFEATERISKENGKMGIKENLNFIKNWNHKDELIKGMFCTHTTFTCSEEMLKEVRELANNYNAGIHIHLEEGAFETMYSIVKYRKLPVEFYEKIGFLGPDVLASQCVHIKPKEIQIFKKYDVKVAHMPLSNLEVAGGIAPIPQMLDSGLTIGLGTDGYIVDMFEVMRSAFLIHKGYLQNALVMPALTVLKMATINGAKAIRMEKDIGSITPGKKADIIIVDPRLPTPITTSNFYDQLVVYCDGNFVNTVIINGKTIMKDKKFVLIDEEKVIEDCRKAALELWKYCESQA